MNERSLGALVVLNVALLIGLALALVTDGTSEAQAQARRPGDYVMLAGEAAGRTNQQVVYIIDLQSTRIAAMLFNSSNNQVEILDGRVISTDVAAARGARP
jgi:hypothetical protein